MFQRLRDRVAQAGHTSHIGVASPVPSGQILRRAERIALGITGHLCPVNAAHGLAPSKNLPDEALCTLQRHKPAVVRRLGSVYHFARRQQLQVQRGRGLRVVQPRLARPHGVLIAAKEWQPLRNENVQRLQRLRASHRPGEARERARMLRKAGLDQGQDLARQHVRLEAGARRQAPRTFGPESCAVVRVEIPLTTDRLALVHEHLVALPQLAVEVLEPQGVAPLGVDGEFAHGIEEMAVLADFQRQPGALDHRLQRLPHAPVARRCHRHSVREQRRQCRLQLGC